MSRGSQREPFMAALRGTGDAGAARHPATFAWLYPQTQVREDRKSPWRFFMASLEEAAGERNAARLRYEALRDELVRQRSEGLMLDETLAALKRLSPSVRALPITSPR
jgi:hypothetical protein